MQTLKIVFWNFVFLGVFAGLSFAGLEFYLRTYQSFNTESVSAVGVPIFTTDAVITYAHQPNKMARNGYGVPTPEIFINSLGLRDDAHFDPQAGSTDVLMLGDSFTFGTGVDQNETFTQKLEARLNGVEMEAGFKPGLGVQSELDLDLNAPEITFNLPSIRENATEVWNAGHIGHSIGQYYLLLKRYHELMGIDTAVVNIFVANDITELRRKTWRYDGLGDLVQVEDLKVFANEAGQLESRTATVPKSRAWHWLKQRFEILSYKLEIENDEFAEPTLTWPVFLAADHPAWDPRLPDFWERFFQGMQMMADYAAEHDIDLRFVIHPMDVQVDDSYRSKYARIYFDQDALASDRPQTQILDFCEARQLNCLDLLPIFRARADRAKLYFSYNADPHYDRLGHEVVAEILARYLTP